MALKYQPSSLEANLRHLDRGAQSVGALATWLSFYMDDAAVVVGEWLDLFRRGAKGDEDEEAEEDAAADGVMMNLLFVAHELLVLTKSKPKSYRKSFENCLPAVAAACTSKTVQSTLSKLLDIWASQDIISKKVIDETRTPLNVSPYGDANCTSAIPELVQTSNLIREIAENKEALEIASRKRKRCTDITEYRTMLHAEMKEMDGVQRAYGKLTTYVKEHILSKLTTSLQHQEEEVRHILDIVTGMQESGARDVPKDEAKTQNAAHPLRVDTGLVFQRGQKIIYRKGEVNESRGVVVMVDLTTVPCSYQVRLDDGKDRFTEGVYLAPDVEEDEDLLGLFTDRPLADIVAPEDTAEVVKWKEVIEPTVLRVLDAFSESVDSV
eukprot:TRINITY_DN10730_c0_g1_i4.p1 TRINITY_DN10730_c0_g1~~TRINITY_DN10730_c0_g1_i4.p1  ORF type:complete len:381 (+),score=109.28 TRINITY_DN10730_c0_g1_i4:349-1491(+)